MSAAIERIKVATERSASSLCSRCCDFGKRGLRSGRRAARCAARARHAQLADGLRRMDALQVTSEAHYVCALQT
eukprot:1970130-Pleurochrysis_carterae.AAC.1